MSPTREQCLAAALRGAAEGLRRDRRVIDHLNVFPVPDGDTGTNLLLTMEAACQAPLQGEGVAVLRGVAQAALLGARGNSGVILSQLLLGLARTWEASGELTGPDLARSLRAACDAAYAGVSKPVEGTILTVARAAAGAAEEAAQVGGGIAEVLVAARTAALVAVSLTPEQLPMLARAGVVDSGGYGLWSALEGACRAIGAASEEGVDDGLLGVQAARRSASGSAEAAPQAGVTHAPGEEWGYCTEFLLRPAQGRPLDLATIRSAVEARGRSVLVVGDSKLAKVHVHVSDPTSLLELARSWGSVDSVKVEDMDRQQRELTAGGVDAPSAATALVAVSAGAGFTTLLRSLGAREVVYVGPAANPSVGELAEAIYRAGSRQVVLLPSDRNCLMAASGAAALAAQRGIMVEVLPCRTPAQGVAAAVAYLPGRPLHENLSAMTLALARVRTVAVTRAARDTEVDGLPVPAGSPLALLDDAPVATGRDEVAALRAALDLALTSAAEIVTVYAGAGSDPAELEALMRELVPAYPAAQVESAHGGQAGSSYLVALE